MITTNTGAKKIENSDNWREIFDAHNTSVDAADRIQPEVAPIINGKQCALSVAVGNFVLLRNSTISGKADGAYEVTKAIPANTNLDSTYIANNPIGGGIANELNNNLTTVDNKFANYVQAPGSMGNDAHVVSMSFEWTEALGWHLNVVDGVGNVRRIKVDASN